MRKAYLFLLLTLTGCLPDKGAELAQCRLEYVKDRYMDSDAIDGAVELCMRVKGYVVIDKWIDSEHKNPNTDCWHVDSVEGAFMPTMPYSTFPWCYEKIGIIDQIKGNM